MALIILRAESKGKMLNSLADLERHADLHISGSPKILEPEIADKTASTILNSKLKFKSKTSALVKVSEDTTKSIMQIRKIHPPGHFIVISEEYSTYKKIEKMFRELKPVIGYYSLKRTSKND